MGRADQAKDAVDEVADALTGHRSGKDEPLASGIGA